MASTRKILDAGAALGAGAFFLSAASLLAQHAPDVNAIWDSSPGDRIGDQLRVAELTTGGLVIVGGTIVSVLSGETWPVLVTLAAVGGTIGVYELLLRRRAA